MAALKPRAAPPAVKKAAPKIKLPRTVAACADRLYQCRLERAAAQKVADELEAEEKAIKEHLINTLPKGEASGTMGRVAKAHVYTRAVPQVKDWTKLYGYIKKNDAWDLLQRRLAEGAVTERLEAKKKIPGVETFNVVTVSCTKL